MAAEHAGAAGPTRRMVDKAIYHLRDLGDFLRQIGHAWKGTQLDTALEILRDQIAELQAKRDALEAENARLYEGWPERGSPNNERLPYPVAGEWRFDQFIPGDGWEWAGPFATKREAVQACLGLDAPAGGGE